MTPADGSYLGFIGVRTAGSSIRRVFPEWAAMLGLPTRTLVGHDVPLDAPPEVYRTLVRQIRDDPMHLGALVTTHKLAIFSAAADLFDHLDDSVELFGEISLIAKRGGQLWGAAKDPLTVRLALDEFLQPDHFRRTGGAALVLGSGGAGCALTHQLGVRTDRPSQIICTALSTEPLNHQRELHQRAGIPSDLVRYAVTADPGEADCLLASLPPASLVVNATGMGKDRPGSPVTDQVRFPASGIIWEFNYRGPLNFYQQARRQEAAQRLTLEDGWRYFVHGWTQAIAGLFDIPMPSEMVDKLSAAAELLR